MCPYSGFYKQKGIRNVRTKNERVCLTLLSLNFKIDFSKDRKSSVPHSLENVLGISALKMKSMPHSSIVKFSTRKSQQKKRVFKSVPHSSILEFSAQDSWLFKKWRITRQWWGYSHLLLSHWRVCLTLLPRIFSAKSEKMTYLNECKIASFLSKILSEI